MEAFIDEFKVVSRERKKRGSKFEKNDTIV